MLNSYVPNLFEMSHSDPSKRLEYFEKVSEFIRINFSKETFIERFGEKAYDAQKLEDAFEAYLAQELVYALDGYDAIGQKFTLIHDGNPVDYHVTDYMSDKEGLNVYTLLPVSDDKAPARLLFRGTWVEDVTARPDTIQATDSKGKLKFASGLDADRKTHIAKDSYMRNRGNIRSWLEKNKGAIVSGHSLGGAYSQHVGSDSWITERCLVSKILTVNAPMIDTASTSQTHLKASAVRHLVVDGDIVTKVGEKLLPGTIVRRETPDLVSHTSGVFYQYGTSGLSYTPVIHKDFESYFKSFASMNLCAQFVRSWFSNDNATSQAPKIMEMKSMSSSPVIVIPA